MRQGQPLAGGKLEARLAALMQQWVAKAPAFASRHCLNLREEDGARCAAYHGIRPFLYCAGLRTSFDTYLRLFAPPLREWTEAAPVPRVLISAAADFVVPALVVRTLRDLGREPAATIVDKCATPLLMCEDAGSRLGLRWETVQEDILRHRSSDGYDLIVSDRFLSFFEPPERSRVIEAWRRLLRAGGRVVTTLSIYPDKRPVARDRETLSLETLRAFEQWQHRVGPGLTQGQLANMVETYSSVRHDHFVSSVEDVLAAFRECGFEIKEVSSIERKVDAHLENGVARSITRIVADRRG